MNIFILPYTCFCFCLVCYRLFTRTSQINELLQQLSIPANWFCMWLEWWHSDELVKKYFGNTGTAAKNSCHFISAPSVLFEGLPSVTPASALTVLTARSVEVSSKKQSLYHLMLLPGATTQTLAQSFRNLMLLLGLLLLLHLHWCELYAKANDDIITIMLVFTVWYVSRKTKY